MELEEGGGEGLLVRPPQETLAGKVEQERVAVVELVKSSALLV